MLIISKKDKYNLICRYSSASFYNSNKNKLYCSTECKEKDKKLKYVQFAEVTLLKTQNFKIKLNFFAL